VEEEIFWKVNGPQWMSLPTFETKGRQHPQQPSIALRAIACRL
jgi:hypothetical protein